VRKVDVLVIGAGVMGAATAWQLARRGHDVLIADQFARGHQHGSSHGGVRIIRWTYPDPYYTALTTEAMPWWRELEAEAGEPLLDLNGVYDHGQPALLTPLADALQACAVPYEWLSPEAAHERVPGLRFDTQVLYHGGGRIFAERAVDALIRLAIERGADARFDHPVRIVSVGDHVEADVGGETVRARRVVVTAGAWVANLLAASAAIGGIALPPLRITAEHLAHYQPVDEHAVWPSFMHHTELFRYGLFTPGEGLKVGGHHEGVVTSIDQPRDEVDLSRIDEIRRYVSEWVPGVEPEPRFGATCLYTTTPSEDFVIDRVGPVVVASPCSGHGFKFAPLIGDMLARLSLDTPVDVVVAPRHRLSAFN